MYTCSCASSSLLNRLIVYLFSTVHVQLQAHSWVLVYVGVAAVPALVGISCIVDLPRSRFCEGKIIHGSWMLSEGCSCTPQRFL